MIVRSWFTALALLALAIWIYLLLGRGRFWRCAERDDRDQPAADPVRWPSVVAVVPARNEAAMLPHSLHSLLGQDYPGPFSVILVDDNSDDGTLAVARELAAGAPGRLAIVGGAPLPAGWTGKLWALHQGIARAEARVAPPDYLLLTDADIGYDAGALQALVRRAGAGDLVMVSLMAKLRCESLSERALIPAFIFFFQMLYPFAWVNLREARTAAAAGGCMLVQRAALAAAGGVASIQGALIDDCALAARLKQQGPVWLGLTERVRSLRPYPSFGDIRRMVARSAYAQLRYSPWILSGAVSALALAYLAAPLIALIGSGAAQLIAAAVWILMAAAFWPTVHFYRLSPGWAPLLPAIAAVYLGFTLDSAGQHRRGRGGLWKGRAQALPADQPSPPPPLPKGRGGSSSGKWTSTNSRKPGS
jgi:hopene-associated glycosyltransferase HpnB